MNIIAAIGTKVLSMVLDKIGQWFQLQRLKQQASKAEALKKQKQSIADAAAKARAEQEALDRDINKYRTNPISDDSFLVGGR